MTKKKAAPAKAAAKTTKTSKAEKSAKTEKTAKAVATEKSAMGAKAPKQSLKAPKQSLKAALEEETPTAPNAPAEGGDEEIDEDEAAAGGGGDGGNAAALAAAGSGEMSASFKNFRHHPDMENFYRFIFENDLRHEALAIMNQMVQQKQAEKAAKKGAPAKR